MNDPFVGREVDGYHILEVLGQGGMGVVYKARNTSLNRVEALKVIAPALVQDSQFLRRFRREAQALARIHHPNIVTVYTLRHAEMGYYLTMEYVEGQTLADYLVEGQGMHWREALPIIKQLLAAFEYAHRRGIIHRDIKPRNIMLTADQVVKVMDFGLAKFYQKHDVTHTQGVSGTLCYMSPEQIKGHSNLDQRSDIFALGMTLYEVLSGRLPFDKNDSQFSIQRAIVEEEFLAPHRLNEDIPVRLSSIVAKAVHKDPEQRYAYAKDMLDAIETFEANVTRTAADAWGATHGEDAPPSRETPTPTRWRNWVIGAALAGGVVWAAWAGYPVLYEQIRDERAGPISNEQVDAAGAVPEKYVEDPSEARAAQDEEAQREPVRSSEEQDRSAEPEAHPPAGPERGGEPQNPSPADEEIRVAESVDAEEARESDSEPPAGAAEEPTTEARPETERPSPPSAEANRGGNETANPASAELPDEPSASSADRVRAETGALQATLRQAITNREWTGLPAPIADFYGTMVDDLRKFDIVRVESTSGEVQEDGTEVTLPVTVYISYRQKGREGVKALPIYAMWIWAEREGAMEVQEVQQR